MAALPMMAMGGMRMPTLGEAATVGNQQAAASPAQQLAALLAQQQMAKQGMERGQALQGEEYINDSGTLGILSALAAKYMGGRVARREGEKASDLTARILQAQTEAETQKQLDAENRRLAAERAARQEKMDVYRRGDRAEMAAYGIEGPEDPKWEQTFIPDPQDPNYEIPVLRSGDKYKSLDGRELFAGQAPAGAAQQVMGDALADSLLDEVQALVSPLGGRITSTTGGKHNPGSKHYSGGAIDIGMARESPEQQAQILAALSANPNLLIRDERTRPAGQKVWSGPHLHVERRGGQPKQSAQAGYSGRRPRFKEEAPKEAQESFSQPQAVTNPQTGQVEMVQFGNRGSVRPVKGYGAPPTSRDAKPPTEGERNAAGYYSRMEAAERDLEATVAAGYKPGNLRDKYTAGQGLLNYAASDLGQGYRQQQEDWVRAKLRKESGAVIGDEEMEREIRVYFPQPGDTPATIAKKAQSRKVALGAMRKSGGRAIDEGGEPSASGAPKRLKFNPATGRIE